MTNIALPLSTHCPMLLYIHFYRFEFLKKHARIIYHFATVEVKRSWDRQLKRHVCTSQNGPYNQRSVDRKDVLPRAHIHVAGGVEMGWKRKTLSMNFQRWKEWECKVEAAEFLTDNFASAAINHEISKMFPSNTSWMSRFNLHPDLQLLWLLVCWSVSNVTSILGNHLITGPSDSNLQTVFV